MTPIQERLLVVLRDLAARYPGMTVEELVAVVERNISDQRQQ